jgi:hypothetical protein
MWSKILNLYVLYFFQTFGKLISQCQIITTTQQHRCSYRRLRDQTRNNLTLSRINYFKKPLIISQHVEPKPSLAEARLRRLWLPGSCLHHEHKFLDSKLPTSHVKHFVYHAYKTEKIKTDRQFVSPYKNEIRTSIT